MCYNYWTGQNPPLSFGSAARFKMVYIGRITVPRTESIVPFSIAKLTLCKYLQSPKDHSCHAVDYRDSIA